MEGLKTRAARAARNRRKRNYTPDSSDFSDEEDEERSNHGNTQLIPTPSIDSVLLNMANQALASASPVSDAQPSPQRQLPTSSSRIRFPPRSLARNDSPEVVASRPIRVEEPRQSVASTLLNLNRTSAPRILNRQPRHFPPPSSVSSSSESMPASDRPVIRPVRVHPPAAPQPAHNTLAANLAEVLNSPHNDLPSSRPISIIRPTNTGTNMPKRNRLSEMSFRDDQFGAEDDSVPFCNKCAHEFPNLLRNLDRLDNRINNLMAVMKSGMEKVRNNGSSQPPQRVQPPPAGVVGFGNSTPAAIKVIPRKPAVVQPVVEPVVEQESSSESDSEPEANAKDVYLSALEKEILQVTPDKFNVAVLNELSETVKETRLTKVTTALEHLVKLRILKALGGSSSPTTSNNSATVLYKKNMKRFAELKL